MDKIDELLTRAVDTIYPSKEELEKSLKSGKKLRVYQGFDPSSPKLHIGHLIGLRKLKLWQELDHEVIFLIGDFTARIGDPTGKEETRPLLSKNEVEKNAHDYKQQAGKILKFEGSNPVKIKFNSQWLDKLTMPEVFNLAAQVTYQQVIKRDMFKKRIDNNQDISFNEILYPIIQGYDSVAMDVDVEVGGRDQLFNMMIGRDLMHKMKRKNKFVMTTQLLTDSQGVKIGKTMANTINLTDQSEKIFGAIMNLPDDIIVSGLEYLTDIPMEEIGQIENKIKTGQNPMPYKKRLALEVVKQLNGESQAQKAQGFFEETIQRGKNPQKPQEVQVKENSTIVEFLVDNELTKSKAGAKRLLVGGAIEIDGQVVRENEFSFKVGQIARIGKKKFVKIKIK